MKQEVLDILRKPAIYPSMRDLSKYNMRFLVLDYGNIGGNLAKSMAAYTHDGEGVVREVRHEPPYPCQMDSAFATKPYTFASDMSCPLEVIEEILSYFPIMSKLPKYEGMIIDGQYFEIEVPEYGVRHSWVSYDESKDLDAWVEKIFRFSEVNNEK